MPDQPLTGHNCPGSCTIVIFRRVRRPHQTEAPPRLYNLKVSAAPAELFHHRVGRDRGRRRELRAKTTADIKEFATPPGRGCRVGRFPQAQLLSPGGFQRHRNLQGNRAKIAEAQAAWNLPGNVLFLSGDHADAVCEGRGPARTGRPHQAGSRAWRRVIIEKTVSAATWPARGLSTTTSASTSKNPRSTASDHYLGKETVQKHHGSSGSANSIFEPIWNRRYIRLRADHRGGGTRRRAARRLLRPLGRAPGHVQNHILSVLSADRHGAAELDFRR